MYFYWPIFYYVEQRVFLQIWMNKPVIERRPLKLSAILYPSLKHHSQFYTFFPFCYIWPFTNAGGSTGLLVFSI